MQKVAFHVKRASNFKTGRKAGSCAMEALTCNQILQNLDFMITG